MLLQTMLIIRRELLTFYVDMKLSNETDLDKIVQRYRVANDPDIYLGGEGEAENETQFLLSLLVYLVQPVFYPIRQTMTSKLHYISLY